MWFGKRKPDAGTPAAANAEAGGASQVPLSGTEKHQHHVQVAFTATLVGAQEIEDRGLNTQESDALQALAKAAKAPDTIASLPRLPAVLPKLLGLVRRESASAGELADQLSTDPVLLGEVIRIANTPYYRSPRPIHSVTDAVQMLGQIGLQQLVARVALRPVFGGQSGRMSKTAGAPLWSLAERCAHGCAWLRSNGGDPFEGYLAGMAANAGMIAALRVLDQQTDNLHAPPSQQFLEALHHTALTLNAPIAHAWSFAPEVIEALVAVAKNGAPDEASLAASVHCSDWVAKSMLLPVSGVLSVPGIALDGLAAACRAELLRSFPPV